MILQYTRRYNIIIIVIIYYYYYQYRYNSFIHTTVQYLNAYTHAGCPTRIRANLKWWVNRVFAHCYPPSHVEIVNLRETCAAVHYVLYTYTMLLLFQRT